MASGSPHDVRPCSGCTGPVDQAPAGIARGTGVERLTGWRPFEYRNYVEV
jgi:hypothetical protein